jgi:serine O-acetyltransferase
MVEITKMFDDCEKVVLTQVSNLLGYDAASFKNAVRAALPNTIDRYRFCLDKKNIKHKPTYVYYHADEYAAFLYFLSNELWKQTQEGSLAEKIYLLNRYINNLDIFYDRELPNIFHLEHPVGAVIGRASFKDYLVVHQGVTIGGNMNLELPTFDENVVIYTGAMVLGRSSIGKNCQIGAGVMIHNEHIPDNTTVVSLNNKKNISTQRDFKAHFFKSY